MSAVRCAPASRLAVASATMPGIYFMLRQHPLRYGRAGLAGFVVGALLFLLQQLLLPTESIAHIHALMFAAGGGALIGCAVAFLWNLALRRAHHRHDQRRGISINQ